MERLAGEREVRFADGLVLRGVRVHELRDLLADSYRSTARARLARLVED